MVVKIGKHTFIKYLIITAPIVDMINGMFSMKSVGSMFSFGQIFRIVLFLFVVSLLIQINSRKSMIILGLLVWSLLRNICYFLFFDASLISNIIFDIKYLYVLAVIFLILSSYKKVLISKQNLIKWGKYAIMISSGCILLMAVTGGGLTYAGSSKGLFMEVNSLTAVQGFGTILFVSELARNNISMNKILQTGIVVIATGTLGTKTGIISVCCAGVFCIWYLKISKKRILNIMIVCVAIVVGMIFFKYFFLEGRGEMTVQRWKYFWNNSSFFTFLVSGRNRSLKYAFNIWNENIFFPICGMGQVLGSALMKQKYIFSQGIIEMDFFDVYYFCGVIIGTLVFINLSKQFIVSIKKVFHRTEECYCDFAYIFLYIVSFFGGHVLTSPFAGTFLAISITLVSEKIKGRRCDIQL